MDARSRGRRCCRRCASWASASSPTPRSGAASCRARSRRPDDLAEGDFRRNNPRFQGENFDENLELVERVRRIADEKDVTPGQLALAWLLHQNPAHPDIVPIPGTKRRSYLEENAAASEIELTSDDLARIDAAAPAGVAAGERYPDMSSIDR